MCAPIPELFTFRKTSRVNPERRTELRTRKEGQETELLRYTSKYLLGFLEKEKEKIGRQYRLHRLCIGRSIGKAEKL